MDKGFYTDKKIDLKKFDITKFNPTFFDEQIYAIAGCGCNLIALLTGINPYKIRKDNKNKNHYSDSFVIDYLKRFKFKIHKITQCEVSNNTSDFLLNTVKPYNIIICCQLVKKNECTWSCIWNGQFSIHNFSINRINPLEFINRPPQSCYLIVHPKWR